MRPCTRRSASVFCMSLRTSALHPQKRCRLLHVIAKHALATAPTPPPSACHCKTRPCNRTHAPAFCMSLRTTPLQPHPRPRLLHVIASQCLAPAEALPPSACHCEPVRTLVWQSASPGRNVVHCCRPRVRTHLPSLSLRTSAGGPAKGHPLRGEEPQGSVALLWPLAGAGHGGLWGDEVRQSASPGRNVVHCCRPRVRTHLPSLSLRTSAHTGAAIRVPAGIPIKHVELWANSQWLRIRRE